MAQKTVQQLKDYFRKGMYPTENQFADLLDSYRHKGENIERSQVSGLTEGLNAKFDLDEAKALDARQKQQESDIERLRLLQVSQSNDITELQEIAEKMNESWGGLPEFSGSAAAFDVLVENYEHYPVGNIYFAKQESCFYKIIKQQGVRRVVSAGDQYNDGETARTGFYVIYRGETPLLYKFYDNGEGSIIPEKIYTESEETLREMIAGLIPSQDKGTTIPTVYFSIADYFSKPSEAIGFTFSYFDDTADGSKIIEVLKDGYAVVNLIIEGFREDTQTSQTLIAKPVTFFFADEDENFLQCTDIVFSYGSYKYLANIELEVDAEQCVRGSIDISRMALSSEINSLKASIENLERIVAPN